MTETDLQYGVSRRGLKVLIKQAACEMFPMANALALDWFRYCFYSQLTERLLIDNRPDFTIGIESIGQKQFEKLAELST